MIHLLVGIPGSGKTTFSQALAKTLDCPIVSSDEVRNLHPDWSEELIWPEIYRLISESLKAGQDLIFDATNITPKVRQRFKDNVEKYGVHLEAGAYFFETPLDECIRRVTIRNTLPNERFLPLEIISSYYSSQVKPQLSEGFAFVKTIRNNEIVETIEK